MTTAEKNGDTRSLFEKMKAGEIFGITKAADGKIYVYDFEKVSWEKNVDGSFTGTPLIETQCKYPECLKAVEGDNKFCKIHL